MLACQYITLLYYLITAALSPLWMLYQIIFSRLKITFLEDMLDYNIQISAHLAQILVIKISATVARQVHAWAAKDTAHFHKNCKRSVFQ